MRRLVTLVVVLLVAHAGWKIGPKYLNYFEFKAEIDEIARFSATKSPEEIHTQVVEAARKSEIPAAASAIKVRRMEERTLIEVAYQESLEILPGYIYPWDVTISVDSYLSKIRLSEIR
jgi:hypothetical protein